MPAEKDVQNNTLVTLSEETDQTEDLDQTENSDQTADPDPADPETPDIGAGEEDVPQPARDASIIRTASAKAAFFFMGSSL